MMPDELMMVRDGGGHRRSSAGASWQPEVAIMLVGRMCRNEQVALGVAGVAMSGR